jgi:hypothetical protein
MKKLFAILSFVLMLPALAQAERPAAMYSTPDLSDIKYYTCEVDTDCRAASLPCGRVAVVNNRNYEQVQGWYKFAESKYKCMDAAPRQEANNIACKQGICTADIQEVSKVLPDSPVTRNPQYCETIEDCAYVNGPCNKKIIINKVYRDNLQKDYDRIRDLRKENCFWPDGRTVRQFTCEKNTCGAILEIPNEAGWRKPTDMKELEKQKALEK